MAEISALTFELNLETEGLESELKNVKAAVSNVFSSLNDSGNNIGSTFDGIINQLRSMSEQLVAAGRGVSTLITLTSAANSTSIIVININADRFLSIPQSGSCYIFC